MGKRAFSCIKGGVIGDDFIGRDNYLSFLNDNLDKKNPKHLSIYGQPHIGKTSIIQEWIRNIKDNGYLSPMGKRVIVLEQTVLTNNDGDDKYGYRYILRCLIRDVLRQIMFFIRNKYPEVENEDIQNIYQELTIKSKEKELSVNELEELLINAIKTTNKYKIRVVIVLDEYERAGQCWEETDYQSFMMILLNKSYDLVCIVASRPHISYIISEHELKLIPFVPVLIHPFNDSDMEEYYKKLFSVLSVDISTMSNQYYQEIAFSCGRNPFLLTVMAALLIDNREEKPVSVFSKNREQFEIHFRDVIDFMLYEEAREQRSFSHIVKCYFGRSSDYSDLISQYIELGYIDINPANSIYSYQDERYVTIYNGEKHYYSTVSTAFINYLFANELDNITDTRDLLTGLVYAIRDITRDELAELFGEEDWNDELLVRLESRSRDNKTGRFVYSFAEKTNGIWTQKNISKERKEWVRNHKDEMIIVSSASIRFAIMECNEKNNLVMPVLDVINLIDNCNIINSYPNLFSKYFDAIGDLSQQKNALELNKRITVIKEARDIISHFSRYGMSESELIKCRKECIDLLKNIYGYQMKKNYK